MLIAGTIVTTVKIFEDGSLSILCQCRSWASILVKVEIGVIRVKGGIRNTDHAEEMTVHVRLIYILISK